MVDGQLILLNVGKNAMDEERPVILKSAYFPFYFACSSIFPAHISFLILIGASPFKLLGRVGLYVFLLL